MTKKYIYIALYRIALLLFGFYYSLFNENIFKNTRFSTNAYHNEVKLVENQKVSK